MERITAIDLELQELISTTTSLLDPSTKVIGEESDPALIRDFITGRFCDTTVLIVDPLDGTSNVTRGIPIYSSVLTHIANDRVVDAAFFDCFQRRFILASTIPILPSECQVNPSNDLSLIASPIKILEYLRHSNLDKEYRCVYNLRCTGYEYLMIARGQVDAAIYTDAKIWEHLAGAALCRNLGLIHSTASGEVYDRTKHKETIVVARNDRILKRLRARIPLN